MDVITKAWQVINDLSRWGVLTAYQKLQVMRYVTDPDYRTPDIEERLKPVFDIADAFKGYWAGDEVELANGCKVAPGNVIEMTEMTLHFVEDRDTVNAVTHEEHQDILDFLAACDRYDDLINGVVKTMQQIGGPVPEGHKTSRDPVTI